MPIPESQELQQYIDVLLEATRAGTVEWKAVNPTTFVWETAAEPRARVNLQRVEKNVFRRAVGETAPGSKVSYVLQAFEVSGPISLQKLKVSVESADDPALNHKLHTLFEFIKSGVSRKGLEFLKEILPR